MAAPPQGIHQQDLMGEIEARRRLVEDEQRRVLREGAGEEDALALAAGELRDGAIGEIERVGFRQRGLRRAGDRAALPATRGRGGAPCPSAPPRAR